MQRGRFGKVVFVASAMSVTVITIIFMAIVFLKDFSRPLLDLRATVPQSMQSVGLLNVCRARCSRTTSGYISSMLQQ